MARATKPKINPKAKEFQDCAVKAVAKFDLAGIYAQDGALRTAAKLYREGADLLEQAAAARDAALSGKP